MTDQCPELIELQQQLWHCVIEINSEEMSLQVVVQLHVIVDVQEKTLHP